MDESSNVSEPSILVSAAAKKLPPTAPDKPDSLFIENAPGDINLDIVDSTPEFSAIFNDANISDSGVFYAIEVELTTNTLIDEFDDNNSSAYSFNALSGVAESNGSFFATSTTSDPYLWRSLSPNINGTDYNIVMIRMKTNFDNPAVKIYWENEDGGFAAARRATSSFIRKDGGWSVYFVDLSGNVNWEGKTIKKFRLDPFADTGKNFEVDYIKILSANGNGISVWNSGITAMNSLAVGNRSQDISYNGSALNSGNYYNWRIKFWDNSGLESPWSDWAKFHYGIL